MELTNEFVIDRGVDETWKILNDLEFIAPCMPGAQLQEIEGDEYRGVVKVKVGPITAQYKGKASFVEQDVENHVSKLEAQGRDPRQGNANAKVTAAMAPTADGQTAVTIHTDLGLSGKIASFGRGAIEDVSKKLLGQFIENLREKLEATGTPGSSNGDLVPAGSTATSEAAAAEPVTGPAAGDRAEAGVDAAAPESVAAESVAAESPSTGSTSPESAPAGAAEAVSTATGSVEDTRSPASAPTDSAVRKVDGPDAEPVDLLAVSAPSVAKRALPAAGGLAMVLIILYWLLGRG
jgi:carbon monoxide dehydrogenase subunit G